MPARQRCLRIAEPRVDGAPFRPFPRTKTFARRELDPPRNLIAPAHSFRLPSLAGVKSKYQVCYGAQNALPLAQALIAKGKLASHHFESCQGVAEVVQKALSEAITTASPAGDDRFDVEIRISDKLDGSESSRDCLFFSWGNSSDPQYIPLWPIFENLAGNPYRESLMASLYCWLYQAGWQVFCAWGYREAECIYGWRKEAYLEARESGEDVDLEGEVECSDPQKVAAYIRNSTELALRGKAVDVALSSIADKSIREAFEKAHQIFLLSRKIKLPDTPVECRSILDDAAYYMEGEPIPGLCISHWRDDPIVAWLDEFYQEQFNSGVTCRAPILRCFRPEDTKTFLQIVSALPWMIKTAFALSDWVRWAEAMENEYNNRDRRQA